jgi:hypothetical protein
MFKTSAFFQFSLQEPRQQGLVAEVLRGRDPAQHPRVRPGSDLQTIRQHPDRVAGQGQRGLLVCNLRARKTAPKPFGELHNFR